MNKKLLFILFILTCNFGSVYAQDNKNSIAVTPVLGINIAAASTPLQGSFWGIQAAYQLSMSNNQDAWIHLLGVKDLGFVFSYLNLGNLSLKSTPGSNGFAGNNYGLLISPDMSIFYVGKTDFLFSPGIGFVYATQTYYTTDVPAVGSHINLAAQAGVKIRTPLSGSTQLQLGFNFFHYSNSAFKLPNDGITMSNASLGIIQYIDSEGPRRERTTFRLDDKNSFEFGIGIGKHGLVQNGLYANPQTGKQIVLADSAAQKAAVSQLYQAGMYAGYNYRLSQLLSLKAGTDVVYYFKPFTYQDFYNTYQEEGTSFDHFSVGLSVGTDIWMGRLAFSLNYGYYLHYATIGTIHTYWDLGGKYYLNSWLALNAKLYLHGLEADYANFGFVFNVD